MRTSSIISIFAWLCAACVATNADVSSSEGAQSNIVGGAIGLNCQPDAAAISPTDYAVSGPYPVGVIEPTFEDFSRPVIANAKHAAAPARTLKTSIYYPAAATPLFGQAPLARGGPFPLLVHSHGYGSSRAEATRLGQRAASYGYVVVAVDFPFTNSDRIIAGESLDTSDVIEQAGDVSFLIDQLLAAASDPVHVLAGAVDATRIGVTGVSLGGLTTLLVAFHPKLQDPRIRLAVPIAPVSSFFMHEFYHTRELPTLFMAGDRDAFVAYERNARRSFERARPNAQLVTLHEGTHAAFAFQLDASSLALMNALLAPADADPANADAFGCAVTGETLSTDHDYIPPLGGRESFIDYDPVREPIIMCAGDEYKRPGMDAIEQVELATRAIVAFAQAQLAVTPEDRADACRYLLQELPKHPAVRVE